VAVDITGLNTKTSTNFTFDAKRGSITIFEQSFVRFLLVVNITKGQNIFNINEVQFKGEQVGKTLNFNYDVKSFKGDKLLVIYESTNTIESTLNELLLEVKELNKLVELVVETIR